MLVELTWLLIYELIAGIAVIAVLEILKPFNRRGRS